MKMNLAEAAEVHRLANEQTEKAVRLAREGERKAWRYVTGIRNPTKRAYAVAYLGCLWADSEIPLIPENLSYMAAQAVRMNLDDIWARAWDA